jgi:pimeloyl-ACP methyl ester carboxylesterase
MNHFTEVLGLSRYTLYMQDYGGPVGFRMALTHPDRIDALIVPAGDSLCPRQRLRLRQHEDERQAAVLDESDHAASHQAGRRKNRDRD